MRSPHRSSSSPSAAARSHSPSGRRNRIWAIVRRRRLSWTKVKPARAKRPGTRGTASPRPAPSGSPTRSPRALRTPRRRRRARNSRSRRRVRSSPCRWRGVECYGDRKVEVAQVLVLVFERREDARRPFRVPAQDRRLDAAAERNRPHVGNEADRGDGRQRERQGQDGIAAIRRSQPLALDGRECDPGARPQPRLRALRLEIDPRALKAGLHLEPVREAPQDVAIEAPAREVARRSVDSIERQGIPGRKSLRREAKDNAAFRVARLCLAPYRIVRSPNPTL